MLSIEADRHKERNAVTLCESMILSISQDLLHNGNGKYLLREKGKTFCVFFEPYVLTQSCYQLTHTLITHINLYSFQVRPDLELFT